MKSCTACELSSACSTPCDRVESLISPNWTTSLRELAIGSVIDVVASSQSHIPVNTELPSFKPLKIIENRILRYFYQDGYSYKQIAKKLCKKKTYVKTTIRRARAKIKRLHNF